MGSNNNKASKELYAFRRFVDIAKIDADLSSVRQLAPPQPDIVCSVSGLDWGFELTALTDSIIERKFGTGIFHYSNYRISILDAVECITRKGQKRYESPRTDLIVHETATPIDDIWLEESSELDAAIQQATNATNFHKVWIVDITNKRTRGYVRNTS